MSTKRSRQDRADADSPADRSPGPTSLTVLASLGVVAALWALFLWAELVLARSGGTSFCPFGEAADCAAIWDADFAKAVQRLTGIPVAGWGLIWSLVAFALPLLALLRSALRRPLPFLVSAVRLIAAAGIAVVFLLMAVSAMERTFCLGCFVTYLLVAGYAGIALFGWKGVGMPDARKGLVSALGTTTAAFLLLLYPGLKTPRAAAAAGRQAIADVGRVPSDLRSSPAPGAGTSVRDDELAAMVTSLNPQLQQTLSDSLHIYRNSLVLPAPEPRALLGSDLAPVRITAFTDVLCDHCAELDETVRLLRQRLPPGSFSLESRHFPLDGRCNPLLKESSTDPVRCLAAKAQICLEGNEKAFAFSSSLFENQKSLTGEKIFELAAPYMPRAGLEACLESETTRQKLEADVALASRFQPDGTPLVLVNGRRGTSFGPFLYAMILTRGEASHLAFDALPPPNPQAHLH